MSTYKIYYSYSTGTPGTYILTVFEGVRVVHLVLFIHVNRFGYFQYHVCVSFSLCLVYSRDFVFGIFSYKKNCSRDYFII